MFRRPFRRRFRRALTGRGPLDEIAWANHLLIDGQPEQAAGLFAQLAGQMEEFNRPRWAANLHAQAAHAWVDAGAEQRALNQARLAVGLFVRLGMAQRAAAFQSDFTRHLRERAFQESAAAFEQETSPGGKLPPAGVPEKRGRLPAVCPQCGAPVRSDMVEWIDGYSATCDFCGATVNSLSE